MRKLLITLTMLFAVINIMAQEHLSLRVFLLREV